MRALVISDTHGDINNAKSAIDLLKPDVIYHLGDLVKDAMKIKKEYPDIPTFYVRGNNDFFGAKNKLIVNFGKFKMLLCHGHQYNVYSSLNKIMFAAKEEKVSAALFGHTHIAFNKSFEDIIFLNPGSPSYPRDHAPSVGVLEIENNKLKSMIYNLL